MDSAPVNHDQYVDTAVRAVTNKRPVPEIDFTLHTMEDGTQVSTLDRVCKGIPNCFTLLWRHQLESMAIEQGVAHDQRVVALHIRRISKVLTDSTIVQMCKRRPSIHLQTINSSQSKIPTSQTSISLSSTSTGRDALPKSKHFSL